MHLPLAMNKTRIVVMFLVQFFSHVHVLHVPCERAPVINGTAHSNLQMKESLMVFIFFFFVFFSARVANFFFFLNVHMHTMQASKWLKSTLNTQVKNFPFTPWPVQDHAINVENHLCWTALACDVCRAICCVSAWCQWRCEESVMPILLHLL